MNSKKQEIKYSLLAVIVFSFLAHGYRFSNNMFSHDSLMMIYQNDYAWQIALGRFVQPFLLFFRGTINNPWLISMLFIIWMSLAVFLVAELLDLKDLLSIIIISGIMTCNVTFTVGNSSFLPWVDFYAMACCLAVLGVWCFKMAFDSMGKVQRKQLVWLIPGILSLVVSMGIYQAYICVAIGLFMILFLKELVCNTEAKQFFIKAALAAGGLLLAALLYYIAWKVFQNVFNIWTADSYNGLAGLGDYSDISVFGLLQLIYSQVGSYLWNPDTFVTLFYHGNSLSIFWLWILRFANILVVLYAVIAVFVINKKTKTGLWQRLLQICIFILFPVGINFVSLISRGMEHSLMIYAFILIYIVSIYVRSLVISISEKKAVTVGKTIAFVIPFALVIWTNVVYANQVYLKQDLIAEASVNLMNRVVNDIENVAGYEPGVTPVAFYGTFQTSEYVQELADFEEITPQGMGKSSVTYSGTDYALLSHVLNVNMNLTRANSTDESMMQRIRGMPCYPAEGAIAYYDGIIIVKIAEY